MTISDEEVLEIKARLEIMERVKVAPTLTWDQLSGLIARLEKAEYNLNDARQELLELGERD